MMTSDIGSFAEKYQLAIENDLVLRRNGGTTGLELEWNLYDSHFRPLREEGTEAGFIDRLRADFIPGWLSDYNQLEVFQWMTEWMTRPYYSAIHTVFEGWVLEACLLNALAAAGAARGERLYAYHGNLLYPTEISHDDIPRGWNLAKRRYLERCVDIYGSSLATAGRHVNVSLPETLLSWDFMHLSPSERGNGHLDAYKNQVYIEGARLMRAFTALSIAITASSPLRADIRTGEPLVILTDVDSNRNLIFPNDRNLDVPYLYRSHEDYVRISYDLVQRGVRFGNNNWTPVRARSSTDPIERIVSITSEQLQELYRKGIYPPERAGGKEEMARQIEQENLCARIDIPMSRIELRTDEGGHDLWMDVAHLTLIELLLILFYADPSFARAFRYDVEDIARARRNESAAAAHGLRAQIENPFSGKLIGMRDFLRWTLDQVRPLAQALGRWDLLEPLREMALGAPNTAGKLRARIQEELGDSVIVPPELLKELAEEREAEVRRQVQEIAARIESANSDAGKLRDLLQTAREAARRQPAPRVPFHPTEQAVIDISYPDKTSEIVALAERLIRIPSVTNCPDERLDEVARAAYFIRDYLEAAGVEVRIFDEGKYPALLAYFPDHLAAPVMLSGHFDVVAPEPDDSQFEPRIEGEYLWGRGSADMKTVVATYLVWMKDQMRQPGAKPAINLLLVGNEENGEIEPAGTPHVLSTLQIERNYIPELLIAGERTGEQGHELMGKVCVENRGVMRFRLIARGEAGHTGTASVPADLADSLLKARADLAELFAAHLTLTAEDGWRSSYRFPFLNVGQPGVYNITATYGELGVEVRLIPEDDLEALIALLEDYAARAGLEPVFEVRDAGIICRPDNPHLRNLLDAIREVSGEEPQTGKKLPGTSARFAPGGQGVVWGQSGLGPHARDERHYIPSIQGYYDALNALARRYVQG